MNKIKYFFTLIFASLAITSCENGENNELPNNPVENSCYKGTMVVGQNDGTTFTQKEVEVDYEIGGDGKLNFVMYKVKFATGMPLKLDMVVEGVDFTETDGVYTLSGDGIVPYAMGGPFEKFTITNLAGEISDNAMSLSFICGEYPVVYNGTKK